MPKPSWKQIQATVHTLIAEDKNYHPDEIEDTDVLRAPAGLRYTDTGLRRLAVKSINPAFFVNGKGLSAKAIKRCVKVGGIVAMVDEQPIADFQ